MSNLTYFKILGINNLRLDRSNPWILLLFLMTVISCKSDTQGVEKPVKEILSVTPQSGTPGTQITVKAIGFTPDSARNKVFIDDTPVEIVEVSQTAIIAEIPSGATSGFLFIEVENETIKGPYFLVTCSKQDGSSGSIKIIAKSNPRVTTDTLKSGKLTVGINRNAGGVINLINIPGIGDIMQEQADLYGRSGQSAIRDRGHGKRYNPTQAGFNETLGTRCKVTHSADKKKLTVEPRPVALWHGDGKYDYSRWENIGADPYKNDGGNSDEDGLDEENLPGKQATEVKSEFNYFGTYEDFKGKYGVETPVIRHYFEYRFICPPGHAINQHRRGTKLFDPSQLVDDISVQHPSGTFKATDKDMSKLMTSWGIRYDIDTWDPNFRYIKPKGKPWEMMNRDNPIRRRRNEGFKQAFILSSSQDVNSGKAIGLYKPYTDINKFRIIGVNESDGSISYKDNRTLGRGSLIVDNARRISTMSVSVFQDEQVGMINRDRLPKNIYEAVRAEVYLFYGTPKEIMDAIVDLDNGLGL